MSDLQKREDSTVMNGPTQAPTARAWASAAVDVLEGDDAFLVFADVPGAARDDVNIEYVGGSCVSPR